jgi:hypothetical protein
MGDTTMNHHCSFCKRSRAEVPAAILIQGTRALICVDCVSKASEAVAGFHPVTSHAGRNVLAVNFNQAATDTGGLDNGVGPA